MLKKQGSIRYQTKGASTVCLLIKQLISKGLKIQGTLLFTPRRPLATKASTTAPFGKLRREIKAIESSFSAEISIKTGSLTTFLATA